MKILETDPTVVSYCEQPLRLEFEWNGRRFLYTPDILSLDVHSRTTLYEVKPKKEIEQDDGRLRIKFEAARSYCSDRAWKFEVVTDSVRSSKEFFRADFLWPHLMNPGVDLNRAKELLQTVEDAACFEMRDIRPISWANPEYCLLLYLIGRGKLVEKPYGRFDEDTMFQVFKSHGE